MITFTCQCGKTYHLEESHAGKTGRCKACNAVMIVPASHPNTDTTIVKQDRPSADFSLAVPEENNAASTATPSNYGNHQIVQMHARGGMGQVSIARDPSLRRDVALKELFESVAHKKDAVQRFLFEAEVTARLEHPGIVPVHSFGTDGKGNPYYTMKLVRGKTFKEAIKDYHDLPEKAENKTTAFRELIRRFSAVCQTMHFAHDRGIIHRDLKPANIMLGEHGETLVMDWGLAKPFIGNGDDTIGDLAVGILDERPDTTLDGTVVGTPTYMAPEQASGKLKLLGPQSDIYSLGVILYQILTNEVPFSGKTSREIVLKVLNDPLPMPSLVQKDVPKGLEAICLKAMTREPSNRYRSAKMMIEDLTNWLEDEPISARQDTRLEKAWRWMRKNRALATTLLVSIFTVLIILGVSGVTIEHARAKTVAATMLANDMKRQAEEAKQRATEKENELTVKEQELADSKQKYVALVDATEEERLPLRNRISALAGDIGTLKVEIKSLHQLSDSILNDNTANLSLEELNARILEYEMAKRLIAKLAEAEQKKQELFQISQKINVALVDARNSNNEDRRKMDNGYYQYVRERIPIRYQLNKAREDALLLSTMTNVIPKLEVQRICDRLPLDWDVITSPNARFAQNYVIEAKASNNNNLRYYTIQEERSPIFSGKQCNFSIMAHAPSRIKLTVPDGADRFTAVGGLNDNLLTVPGTGHVPDQLYWTVGSNMWFYQVFCDDDLVYESTLPLDYPERAIYIDVPIPPGTKTLTLVINDNTWETADWSCWGWPMFHFKGQAPPPPRPNSQANSDVLSKFLVYANGTSASVTDTNGTINITDADIAVLAKAHPNLTSINFVMCSKITGAGLEGFTKLKSLALQSCHNLTDDGLRSLKDMTQLEQVMLTFCENITDAGAEHLKGLTNLTGLQIVSSGITDTGLQHFKNMQKLRMLNLNLSQNITQKGIEDLKKVLPECQIMHKTQLGGTQNQ